MLAKVAGKDTQTVVSALIKQAKNPPTELYKSLTWDRGKELQPQQRDSTPVLRRSVEPASQERTSNSNALIR
jgi:IS30 family transposase